MSDHNDKLHEIVEWLMTREEGCTLQEMHEAIDENRFPEDVQRFLQSYAEADVEGMEVLGIWDDVVESCKELCEKYGIKYMARLEWNEDETLCREVYSDGTKGEWE